MRLPYVPDPPPVSSVQDQEVVDRIRARRGARGLTNLDRTLLISPPVANGWNTFLGAIRTQTSLSVSIREAAICRVATLNRAWFEFEHHAPLLLTATLGDGPEKVNPLFVRSILVMAPGDWDNWEVAKHYGTPDETHGLVVAFTDALTLLGPVMPTSDVPTSISENEKFGVPQKLFDRVKEQFSDKEVVELVATISSYNCVSRFLLALDVGERAGKEGMDIALKNVIAGPGGEGLGKIVNTNKWDETMWPARIYDLSKN